MPSPATVAKALELIERGAENHSYFFSKLKSPEWIEPLVEAGFFKDPPPPRKHGDYVSYPTWPESKYLERMAPVAPTQVARVIGQIPDTDNISVREDLARAAIRLEAKPMARWATKEARWVSRQQHIQFPLGEALGAVIERLAKLEKTGAALELARSLLAIRCVVDSNRLGSVREPPQPYDSGLERSNGEPADEEDPEISELAASVVARLSSRIVGRLSPYDYRRFVDRHVPVLLTCGGIEAFEMLCDLLEEAVESDKLGKYSGSIWRPAIEPHGQNQGTEVSDSLIDAIRDASVALVDNGVTLATVVASLAQRQSPVFKRMVLHLASERHSQNPELAAQLAVCEDHFRDERLLHEYSRLLGAVFPVMDDVRKNRVMGWIGSGPAVQDSFAGDDEERRRSKIYWQARRLAWIRDNLDDEWKKRYAAIIDEVGELEHPDLTSYTTTWMGPRSPVSGEELGSLSTEAIAQYVKSWQPSGDPRAPDEEGLAQTLEALVAGTPDEFVKSSASFLEAPARYVSAVLRGLSQAVRDERALDWAATIGLMSRIGDRKSDDPEWKSTLQDSIRLLQTGMQDDLIDIRLRKAVWTIIDVAADDSDPTPDTDSKLVGDPSIRSTSTVRGNALHAVVTYSLWVYRSVTGTGQAEPGAFSMDRIPEVRTRLERHLDPGIDPSPAIRSVFGQWFPYLVLLDEAWARQHVARIFPDDQPELRDAAWETYLRFCRVYNLPFEMLRGQYLAAVSRLGKTGKRALSRGERTGGFLGEHLVILAGRGLVAWSDGDSLLKRFFENSEPDDADQAIRLIGRDLSDEDNEIPGDTIHRFQRLADELLGLLHEAGRERMGHLGSLGWWIASGRFDPEWTLASLTRLLELAGAAEPSFEVMDTLAELSESHPAKAFEVFRIWVNMSTDSTGRSVPLIDDEPARTILGRALANPPTVHNARSFIHRLGAAGHLSFRDLLEG